MRVARVRFASVLLVLAVVSAACGGGGGGGGGAGSKAAAEACPVDALATAAKPVGITFWHSMSAANNDLLVKMIDEFNAAQGDVKVTLVQQPSYPETLLKWRAAATAGQVPDLVQLEETTVQSMVDSKSAIPMQACVDAAKYSLADFLPRTIDYYTTQGVLRAMPWNVSNPVLLYNRKAFAQAGLDPDSPPKTLAEVRTAAQKIVAAGVATHGIALKVLPYYNEFWYAKAGVAYVDNGNGRDARATKANLDNPTGLALWTWWKQMVDDGLALNVGTTADPDHLFALGTGAAAMTIDASSVIGPVEAVLGTGQFPNVEIGAAAMPGLAAGGGVPVGDGALWISAASPPEKRAAAWKLITFLDDPAQQARLHIAGGFVPIRRSALDDPALRALWAQKPYMRAAYDQLESGPSGTATSGSVIGDYHGVRDAVVNGIMAMLSTGMAPSAALQQAQRQADDAIRSYNERVGG